VPRTLGQKCFDWGGESQLSVNKRLQTVETMQHFVANAISRLRHQMRASPVSQGQPRRDAQIRPLAARGAGIVSRNVSPFALTG